MSPRSIIQSIPWVMLGILVVLFCAHDNPGPDYWYHLFLGRRVIETGSAQPTDFLVGTMPHYVNSYWLFQIALYGAYSLLQQTGPFLVFSLLCLITAFCWCKTTGVHRFYGPRFAFAYLLSFLSLVIWNLRFEWRPELVSYASAAIFVYVLNTSDFSKPLSRRGWAILGITQWIWSNAHGYFALGIILCGCRLVGSVLMPTAGTRTFESEKRIFSVLFFCFVVSLLGPLTVHSWTNTLHMHTFLNEMTTRIQEFMPPTHPIFTRSWCVKVFWGLWVVTLIGIPMGLTRGASRFSVLIAALGLYLSGRYYRNIPLLPILSAPLWSQLLALIPQFAKKKPDINSLSTGFVFARLAAAAVPVVLMVKTVDGSYYRGKYSSTQFGYAISPEHSPKEFVEFIRPLPFPGVIFNTPSDGGFLEFFLPDLKIYGDSRFCDRVSTARYFDAMHDPRQFDELDSSYHFDGVLLMVLENQYLMPHLLNSEKWRLVYGDLGRAFFVKSVPSSTPLLSSQHFDFYDDQDMTLGDNATRSYQWVLFLANQNRTDLLEQALRSFLSAPAIHPGVLATGIRYYQLKGDTVALKDLRKVAGNMMHLGHPEEGFVTKALSSVAPR